MKKEAKSKLKLKKKIVTKLNTNQMISVKGGSYPCTIDCPDTEAA